jgi:tRNA nucleotidyltransferase (CCA-adding enzyme)
MSCQIKRKYDGSIKGVYAPNGNESILYSNIVDNVSIEDMSSDPYVQSIMDKGLIVDASIKELALALWSKAYTPEFIESFGDWKADKLPNTDVNGEPLYSALKNGIKSDDSIAREIEMYSLDSPSVIDALFKNILDAEEAPVKLDINISPIEPIFNSFKNKGIKGLIVGGSVRDALIGKKPKDVDVEVYGLTIDELKAELEQFGRVDEVGKAFGILKFTPYVPGTKSLVKLEDPYDFSVPRRENKIGIGHKGFNVEFDKSISIEEAASRRDFTFNSLAYDPINEIVYNYFDGLNDLKNKILRHTSAQFEEDPLRVLRALQFQSRMGFDIAPETIDLMKTMVERGDMDALPKERISEEWLKWAVKSQNPELLFDFLRNTGLGNRYYSALMRLKDTPQDLLFHPEGDVEEHTKQVLQQAHKLTEIDGISGERKAVLILSALLHDIAKPLVTEEVYSEKYGRKVIKSPGHEEAGVEPAKDFLESIGIPSKIIDKVLPLVRDHLMHVHIDSIPNLGSKYKALAKYIGRFGKAELQDMIYLIKADSLGRTENAKIPESLNNLIDLYADFSRKFGEKYNPIITGKDLVQLGIKPGPNFKKILDKAKEAHLLGKLTVENKNEWLVRYLKSSGEKPILFEEGVKKTESSVLPKELVYDEIKSALIDAGFDIKSLEEASKITGKDYKNVNALVNFAVKMVALSNDANVLDIAEEAAHVAVAHGKLKNISLYNRAIELVKSTDEYREDYDRYKSRYVFEYGADIAEALALEEILGKIVRKHIIEGFDRSSDKGLIRVLKTLWEKFLSLFRKDSLNNIAQKYASDFIKGKVKAENIEQSTEFYSLQKEGVTYKQLLDSLLKREKALTTKKGANVINIRRQIKSIREQIDDLTQLTGTIKFIGYLDQDTQTALSYLKSSFDIATTDEEVSNLQIRLRQLREKYTESPSDELKELIQSTRKNIRLLSKNKYKRITLRSDAAIPSLNHIHQYQELIQYYMPYLKDLKDVMLNQQESLGKRLGIPVSAVGARAIDKQIEKLTMIKEMIDVLTPKALEINLAKDVSDIAGEKETGVDLSQEIAYGSNISSSIWYWFGSLRDSSDTLNRLVSTMMNNIYNLVRRKTLDKATEILTEFKDLIGKDTSWMYEVVDGKRTGRYIDDLLWTSHYNARKKFHKDLHTKYGFPEDSHQRNKLKREINGYANIIKAMKRNSVLSDEDKASIRRMELAMEKLRRYNDEVRTWYKENTVPRTNLTVIIDEARQKLSRNQFREWIDRNIEFNAKDEDVAMEAAWNNDPNWYSYVSYYKYNFVQPSNGKIITVENFDGTTSKIKTVDWTNKSYNLLTDEQKNQLTRLKEIKKEIDVNLLNIPINDLPPQIYESTMDLLFRNDFPSIWKKLRGHLGSAFVTESDDIQFNPDLYQTDQSLSGYVPIRYTHRMEDPARISTDALSSLVMYYNMATEYNEKSKNFAKFSVILEHVKNRKIITQDKKGNLVTEGSKSWNTRGLEQFLKVHLLGQGKDLLEYETPLGKVNVSKIVQNVSSWIRAKNLGLNFATMFSNFASSEAFLAIERIVGQYLNKESYTKSYGTLMSNLTDLMNNNANNKIAVLRRTFGLGRDLHTLFNDLDKNLFVRDQPSKFMFYGYEIGDFMTKSIAMLSVLYDYKLYNGAWYSSRELKAMKITDTDLVNMYDYLTVDKGKIGNDIDPKVIDRISNKIQYVANGIDGKITDVDRGAIYQHAIFSMVTIHRNWLFDGISKRFKAEGFNFRTLEYEKGYYRDFPSAFQVIGNFFYSDKRILSLHKAMLKYDSLQPWQKDNVKRLYTEMLMVAGFTVLAVLINQAAGDDEDDDAMDLLAYLSNRMLLEVSSFYNPTEITTAVTSPFVPMRDIELVMDFGKALDFSEIDRGPWKGYRHAEKYFLQWIPGVKGINLIRDPQSANQFLKNKPLKPLYTIVE